MGMKNNQPSLLTVSTLCTPPQNSVGLCSVLAVGASDVGAKASAGRAELIPTDTTGTGEEEVRGDCSLRRAARQWVKRQDDQGTNISCHPAWPSSPPQCSLSPLSVHIPQALITFEYMYI